jgi:penicillin-binding protein 2
MRVKIAHILIILIFCIMALSLINLNIIRGSKYKELSNKNCIRLIPQPGCRGRIFDRNHQIIIDNVISYDVTVLPSEAEELDKLLSKVSMVLGRSPEDLKKKFKSGFISASIPVTIIKNIDTRKAIALEELKAEIPGLAIEPRPMRRYPYGSLAVHVIGYLGEIDRWRLTQLSDYGYKNKDIVGFGGAEEMYDYYLRQEDGGLSIEVDRKGRQVRVMGFKPPKSGRDIQVTLDLKIQRIVEDKLGDKKGCVVMMDPYSGEIIALANSPSFDPSAFIKRSNRDILDFFNNPNAPLYNRAVSGAYPAGSVFKVIIAAAGLETGKINLKTTFTCPGSFNIGKQQFLCWEPHGDQNLIAAITHSCNVFFYRTGILLGPQNIHDYAAKFGLGKPTNIDLPAESSGFVPDPLWKKIYRLKGWFSGDTANLSIGQGDLLVTPLQIARVMAVFANNGQLVNPHILKSVQDQEDVYYDRKILSLGIKASTLENIRKGLRSVASGDGTANMLATLPIEIAGKTGTAQVSGKQAHGWFAGFFPYKKPRYVICVFLEHGGSGYMASLLTKNIIETMVTQALL